MVNTNCKTASHKNQLASLLCCAKSASVVMTCVNDAGKPPSAFPQDRLHIDFSQEVNIGRKLAATVDGLLEPLVEDRLTAAEALDMLTEDVEQPQASSSAKDRSSMNYTADCLSCMSMKHSVMQDGLHIVQAGRLPQISASTCV